MFGRHEKPKIDHDLLEITQDALECLRDYYSKEMRNPQYKSEERIFFDKQKRRAEKAMIDWRRLRYQLKDFPQGIMIDFDPKTLIARED